MILLLFLNNPKILISFCICSNILNKYLVAENILENQTMKKEEVGVSRFILTLCVIVHCADPPPILFLSETSDFLKSSYNAGNVLKHAKYIYFFLMFSLNQFVFKLWWPEIIYIYFFNSRNLSFLSSGDPRVGAAYGFPY